VVALEHARLDDAVTVPQDSTKVGESTSFLRVGEKLPMSELLEALLIKSGNDAAIAIAEHVSGSEHAFVSLMNDKAEELGLDHTRFKNSHGLDERGQYSSARDLAILARYAMTKPAFREIVAKKRARIGTGKRSERIESTNLLIGNYTGANGVKTGWTDEAGFSVVDSARRGRVELYAVVLGADGELSRFTDARELLDFGFAHYREQLLSSAGTVIGEAPVKDYLDVAVPAAVSENTSVAVFDLTGPITRSVTVSAVDAPVAKGQRVGVATFTQRGNVIASVPLVAVEPVPEPSPLQKVGIAIVRVWRRLTGADSAGAALPAKEVAAAGVSY
jgi:D-alanyl-D-alanine carboxypeptidase (penicillin-binding protein 5/6)